MDLSQLVILSSNSLARRWPEITSLLNYPICVKVLGYFNSGGILASGDRFGLEPAIQYVATILATSASVAARMVLVSIMDENFKAECFETARLAAMLKDRPETKFGEGGISAISFVHSNTAMASRPSPYSDCVLKPRLDPR